MIFYYFVCIRITNKKFTTIHYNMFTKFIGTFSRNFGIIFSEASSGATSNCNGVENFSSTETLTNNSNNDASDTLSINELLPNCLQITDDVQQVSILLLYTTGTSILLLPNFDFCFLYFAEIT